MEILLENKHLLYSLLISTGTVLSLATGLLPEFGEKFELVPFPPKVKALLLILIYYMDVHHSFFSSEMWCWLCLSLIWLVVMFWTEWFFSFSVMYDDASPCCFVVPASNEINESYIIMMN